MAQNARAAIVSQVLQEGEKFGRSNEFAGKSVLLEYVSANPTGPLHLGHARQGALGDVLANLLDSQGWKVSREFYYNDAGVPITANTSSLSHAIFWIKNPSFRTAASLLNPPETTVILI